jgi:hypothetical protein
MPPLVDVDVSAHQGAMSKKTNKKKNDQTEAPSAADEVRAAFDAGSYAGVRRLALTIPADATPEARAEIDHLVRTVALDPVQIAVGVGALVVVVLVGFLTLHT